MRIQSRTTLPGSRNEKELAFLKTLNQAEPIQPIVEIAQNVSRHSLRWESALDPVVKSLLQILNQIGLADFFDCIVGSEDTPRHKPEPDVFLEVARRINILPEKCCVFEDADLGIEAAGGPAWPVLISEPFTNRDRSASCF